MAGSLNDVRAESAVRKTEVEFAADDFEKAGNFAGAAHGVTSAHVPGKAVFGCPFWLAGKLAVQETTSVN
jgi:hypothetical protein